MKVYIVYGGPSSENSVSQKSKTLFAKLLQKYSPILVEWKDEETFQLEGRNLSLPEFFTLIKESDGVFVNAMHGEFCEDGWIQKKLEKYKISFTGPSSKAAELSMDKESSQEAVKDIINVIPTFSIQVEKGRETYDSELEKLKILNWQFPLFIKPNGKGSSVGIFKVKDINHLKQMLLKLEQDKYLIQPEVRGREISIGTVCDRGEYLDLPATEIVPKGEFFDYDSKYSVAGSREITPANISEDLMTRVKKASIDIHNRLNLGCYSRTDMILVNNDIYYLETNSLPGMTECSLLPQQLRNIGMLEKFGEILLRNLNIPL